MVVLTPTKKAVQTSLLPEEKLWESNLIARAEWHTTSPFTEKIVAMLIHDFQQTGEFDEKEFTILDIVGSYAQHTEYEEAKNLSKKIRADYIHLPLEGRDFADFNIFRGRIYYSDKKKTIKIGLNPDLLQFYTNIAKNFTVFQITEFLGLKLGKGWHYAQRLYNHLKSWEPHKASDEGKWIVAVDELRRLLGATAKTYDHFTDFTRMIDKALANINKSTSMEVDYTTHKKGKNVTHFIFQHHTYTPINRQPPQLTKPQKPKTRFDETDKELITRMEFLRSQQMKATIAQLQKKGFTLEEMYTAIKDAAIAGGMPGLKYTKKEIQSVLDAIKVSEFIKKQ